MMGWRLKGSVSLQSIKQGFDIMILDRTDAFLIRFGDGGRNMIELMSQKGDVDCCYCTHSSISTYPSLPPFSFPSPSINNPPSKSICKNHFVVGAF